MKLIQIKAAYQIVRKIFMIDLDQIQWKVKIKKRNTYKSAYALYERRELILNFFRGPIFLIKT